MISLFGGMLYLTAGVLAYVFLNDFMDVYAYLGLFAAVTLLLILLLLLWLHKGAAKLWVRIG
jgi:ABC-2 type transport system permease protein